MKLFVKILIGLVALFIISLIALVVFFPKERVKNYVLKKLQDQTEMPLKVEDVSLSLYPNFAFTLKGFEMGDHNHLIHASVEDFRIRTGIKTLLDNDIHISNISMIKPILKVYTKHASTSDSQDEINIDTDVSTEKSKSSDLLINKIFIEDGEVWVFDKKDKENVKILDIDQDVKIHLDDAQIIRIEGKTSSSQIWAAGSNLPAIALATHKNISFDSQKQLLTIKDSTFNIQDLPLSLNGTVAFDQKNVFAADIDLETAPSKLSSIFKIIPSLQSGDWKTSGEFAAKGKIKGSFHTDDFLTSFEKSDSDIQITLRDGSLANKKHQVDLMPVSFTTNIKPKRIDIENLQMTSKASKLRAQGSINDYLRNGSMDLNIDSDILLSELQAWIDESIIKNMKGTADLKLRIQGPLDFKNADFVGTLDVKDGAFFDPNLQYDIQALSGKLELQKSKTLLTNLKAKIEESDIHISQAQFSAWKTFINEKDTITFTANASSDFINYLDVLPKSENNAADEKLPLELPDIFYRLDGSGKALAKKILYNGTTFTNANASFTLKKGKLNLQPLEVGTFGGGFTAKGLVDFTPKTKFPFDMDVKLKDASVQKALTFATSIEKLVHLKDSLTAKISLSTKAKGELSNFLDLNLASLTSDGDFSLNDANLKNHPLQKKLSTYLSASEFKEFNVKQWTQSFSVKDGKFHVKDLNLAAKDFAFKLDGYQALDGSQSYNLDATLPSSFKNKIQSKLPVDVFSIFAKSSQSNFTLPFNIGGTFNSPALSLNNKKIQNQAKNNVKDKVKSDLQSKTDKLKDGLKDQLKNKLDPQKGTTTPNTKDKIKEDAKKEIKDLGKKFKKLF